ncbi:hypothetical protein ACJX0J_011849, partial [Zea mays]
GPFIANIIQCCCRYLFCYGLAKEYEVQYSHLFGDWQGVAKFLSSGGRLLTQQMDGMGIKLMEWHNMLNLLSNVTLNLMEFSLPISINHIIGRNERYSLKEESQHQILDLVSLSRQGFSDVIIV